MMKLKIKGCEAPKIFQCMKGEKYRDWQFQLALHEKHYIMQASLIVTNLFVKRPEHILMCMSSCQWSLQTQTRDGCAVAVETLGLQDGKKVDHV